MSTESFWNTVGEVSEELAVEVYAKDHLIKRIKLEEAGTYIGRMAENHVVLDDPKVSRSHARIVKEDGSWWVEDQQSENGLRVNGDKCERSKIDIGDEVVLGSHKLKIVRDDGAATADISSQLEYGDAPFRSESTVMISDAAEHEKMLQRMAEKRAQAQSKVTQSAPKRLPQLRYKLEILGKVFEDTLQFEKGKKVEASGQDNSIEIQIRYGQWVMYQKVKLD